MVSKLEWSLEDARWELDRSYLKCKEKIAAIICHMESTYTKEMEILLRDDEAGKDGAWVNTVLCFVASVQKKSRSWRSVF